MKASKLTYLLIAGALTFVASGCKKNPTGITKLPGYSNQTPRDGSPIEDGKKIGPGEGFDATTGAHALPTNIDPDQMNNDRAALAAHTVHFDYDSTAIRSGEKGNVQAVADYMKAAAANVALLVEGHCDERGTEEYNRALGERRALALREALISAGADGQKIVTRSYGKDRKIDLGSSEASHARNRRGEFVVLTPK